MDNAFISSLYFRNAIESADFEKTAQWDALLDLTYAVWRVADVTVENELLKNRLKQTAMDILTEYPNAITGHKKGVEVMEKIRSQCALLSLAQRTVHGSREMNFFILKNEYYKISAALSQHIAAAVPDASHQVKYHQHHEEKQEQKKQPASPEQKEKVAAEAQRENPVAPLVAKKPVVTNALNDRQKKILQFFNKRKGENVRLKEIAQFFPDLTDRTVRNDLRDLCMKKMISRSEGHGQASFYRLAKNGIEEGIKEGVQ